jgi:hypothetical protein
MAPSYTRSPPVLDVVGSLRVYIGDGWIDRVQVANYVKQAGP